jgi:hypothetical protein
LVIDLLMILIISCLIIVIVDCAEVYNSWWLLDFAIDKYHAWVNAEFLLEKCLVGFLDPNE